MSDVDLHSAAGDANPRRLVVHTNLSIPEQELKFSFSRSGGPGGQNVNKVNSKATLHWDVLHTQSLPDGVKHRFLAKFRNRLRTDGVLVLSSQRFRDQPRNVDDCREKLAEMVRSVLTPPKSRRATKPTRGSRERRLKAKRHQSERKSGRQVRGGSE